MQGRRSNSNSNPYQSFNSNSNSVSAEAGAGASLSGRLDAAVAELAAVTADPELSVHARGFEVHSVREDAAVRLHDLGQRLRRELQGAEERRLQVRVLMCRLCSLLNLLKSLGFVWGVWGLLRCTA